MSEKDELEITVLAGTMTGMWNAAIEAAALAIEAELLSAYPRVGSYSQAVREAAESVRKLVIYDAAATVRRLKR